VTNMNRMFAHATSFNQPIDAWDTHNLTNMRGMFDGGCPLQQSPPHWYH
jgi:surface protein